MPFSGTKRPTKRMNREGSPSFSRNSVAWTLVFSAWVANKLLSTASGAVKILASGDPSDLRYSKEALPGTTNLSQCLKK